MDKDLFEGLVQSLNEAVAHSKGELVLKSTVSNVSVISPPIFTPDEIISLRKKARVSQQIFAHIMGVSKKTVESWESGYNTPSGPARRLLWEIKKDPEYVEQYLIHA